VSSTAILLYRYFLITQYPTLRDLLDAERYSGLKDSANSAFGNSHLRSHSNRPQTRKHHLRWYELSQTPTPRRRGPPSPEHIILFWQANARQFVGHGAPFGNTARHTDSFGL
jgi:hypothetical protein